MPRPLILFSVCCTFTLGVLAGDLPTTGQLYGKLKRENYIAPGGFYTVSIPVLPELGGEITDTENVVTFDDSVSIHISLANFPLDMSQKWDLGEKGLREYLTGFFTTYVLSDFQTRFPGATAESTLFIPELMKGSLMSFTLLPGGSVYSGQLNIPGASAETPPIAKRGNLLFVQSDRIYILSIELAERITQKKFFNKTAEEENAILRERLILFTKRIQFPAPKPVKKN